MTQKFYQHRKTRNLFLCLSVLLIVFLCLSVFGRSARAQTQTFTAIPPRLEIKVKPGEFVKQTIQFRNEGDTLVYPAAIAKDFIVNDQKGTPEFVSQTVSGRWSASSWIKISPESFAVLPKQTFNLTISINTPIDALPGGHYAGILYQSSGTPAGTGAGSGITQVVGTIIYLTVEGIITENAKVKLFETPNFAEYGPINFATEINNLSDIHITPKGQITIKNMFGKTTAVLPLVERNIFPLASFHYDNSWNTKYLFGRYRADLAAAYGTKGQALTATLYFIVFPVKIALAVLLAVVIIILIILLIRRRSQKQELPPVPQKTPDMTPAA